MKTIKVKQEFQLPGTDIVLEAGDIIQITEGSFYSYFVDPNETEWIVESLGGDQKTLNQLEQILSGSLSKGKFRLVHHPEENNTEWTEEEARDKFYGLKETILSSEEGYLMILHGDGLIALGAGSDGMSAEYAYYADNSIE